MFYGFWEFNEGLMDVMVNFDIKKLGIADEVMWGTLSLIPYTF